MLSGGKDALGQAVRLIDVDDAVSYLFFLFPAPECLLLVAVGGGTILFSN